LQGIASGGQEVPIESDHVLMVSSEAPTSHDLLILPDLLILSSEGTDSILLGVVYRRWMQ
jgi:hypothetical protein